MSEYALILISKVSTYSVQDKMDKTESIESVLLNAYSVFKQ